MKSHTEPIVWFEVLEALFKNTPTRFISFKEFHPQLGEPIWVYGDVKEIALIRTSRHDVEIPRLTLHKVRRTSKYSEEHVPVRAPVQVILTDLVFGMHCQAIRFQYPNKGRGVQIKYTTNTAKALIMTPEQVTYTIYTT